MLWDEDSELRHLTGVVTRRRTQYNAARIKRRTISVGPLNCKPGGCYAPVRVPDRCPDLGPGDWLPRAEKCRDRPPAPHKLCGSGKVAGCQNITPESRGVRPWNRADGALSTNHR